MLHKDTDAVRHFVRGTLGCKCPDDVFESIATTREQESKTGTPYLRLLVGDRLLIYVLDTHFAANLPAAVSALAARGRAERETNHLNRFRLVLAAAFPSQVPVDVLSTFTDAPGHDDRTHLHVIAMDQLPGLLQPR